MRTTITILLAFVMFRLSSQTTAAYDIYDPPTKVVGTSTMRTCREMKSNCKAGKLIKNERIGIADTTVVYIDGYVVDMTGKRMPEAFFKFINRKTKEGYLLITDSTGRLKISGFPAGTYTLKVNKFGYKEFVVTGLKFGTGDKRNIIVDIGEYCCTKVEVTSENHDNPSDPSDKNKKGN